MVTEKPLVLRCTELLATLLRDYARIYRLSSSISVAHDIETMSRRGESEGLVFFHSTLKLISDALLITLENDALPTSLPFKCKKGTKIPIFLGDYWKLIIKESGEALPNPDINAVKVLYQVGNLFAKLELPYPPEVVKENLDRFIATDRSVGYPTHFSSRDRENLLSRATNLATRVLEGVDLLDIRPKHGPGAVADGQKQEGKWEFSTLYLDLDRVYSYYEYFSSGIRQFTDRLPAYAALKWREWSRAKLCLVPKTATKPRLISIEPAEKMFIQQGQMVKLVKHIERHHLTAGQVNFTYQSINQNLALQSSLTKDYATIDLSDASDLVSISLVRDLLRNLPELEKCLMASRSSYTILPDGREVALRKFAPMGSATCFPIESIAFYCVAVASILEADPTYDWRAWIGHVYVYGDDIIVPSMYTPDVIRGLEMVGLRVNTTKSYWKGYFRESCGMHAYKGHDITPVRVKKPFTSKRGDGTTLSTYTDYAHAFVRQGALATAELIYGWIEELTNTVLPYGVPGCGYLARFCESSERASMLNYGHVKSRWNKDLQRREFLVLALKVRKRDVHYLDNWNRLLSSLLSGPSEEDPSKTVLLRSVQIKRSWRP